MKEVAFDTSRLPVETATFVACLATILELDPQDIPQPSPEEDPAKGWTIRRWLGGRAHGARARRRSRHVRVGRSVDRARPRRRRRSARRRDVRHPVGRRVGPVRGDRDRKAGRSRTASWSRRSTSRSRRRRAQPLRSASGTVEAIRIAAAAGIPSAAVDSVRALAGRGLEGDRHVTGDGTFPSGVPGSALTLIEAEVCESFTPRARARRASPQRRHPRHRAERPGRPRVHGRDAPAAAACGSASRAS